MTRNIKNKVTGSLVNITTYDPVTGEITGFAPVGNIELGPVANVSILGGTNGQVLSTDGTGNLAWVTGGGGGGNGTAIANGTTSVSIPAAGGNVQVTVGGTLVANVTSTGATITGNLIPSANVTYDLGSSTAMWKSMYIGPNTLYINNIPLSVGSGNALTFGGNALVVEGVQQTGNVITSGNVTANGVNANIVTATQRANLGQVANVTILGGTNGQVLQTDGTGNLSWTTGGGGGNGSPGGTNTQVQYNNAGAFGGDAGFTYNNTTDTLNVGSIVGNGAGLSAITGANVTGTVANATFALTTGAANTAATVTTNAQPNITSVGTLSALSVTGNVSAGNVSATTVTGSLATAAQPNITSVGTLSALSVTGNVSAGNVSATTVTGSLATAAQPNVTSLGTLTGLTVNGTANLSAVGNVKITGGTNGQFLQTDGAGNLTWATGGSGGNGTPGGSNTQIQFNDAGAFGGSANLTFDKSTGALSATSIAGNGSGLTAITGANVTGIVANAAFATLAATANTVAGANVTGTVANATFATTAGAANTVAGANVTGIVANATFATTAGEANTVAGANVTGTVANATYALTSNVANTAATVTTNAQPNITSVGTLTALTVSGNTSLGAIGNVKITGGTTGQLLSTDGNGNLSWNSPAGTTGNITFAAANISTNLVNTDINVLNAGTGRIGVQTAGGGLTVLANGATQFSGDIRAISASPAPSIRGFDSGYFSGNVGGNLGSFVTVAVDSLDASGAIPYTDSLKHLASDPTFTYNDTSSLLSVGNVTISGNLDANFITANGGLINGNLAITGNLTYIEQTTVTVEDPIIQLGVAANGSPLALNDGKDRGVETHTFGANLVTTVLAPLTLANEVELTDAGSIDLIGQAFYSNAANGEATWPANTTVIGFDAPNNSVTLSSDRLWTPDVGDTIIIGADKLQFMGYINSANLFVVASNVTNSNNIITVNKYGNFQANTIFGNVANFTGNVNTAANLNAVSANLSGNVIAIGNVSANNVTATGNAAANNVTVTSNVAAGNITVTGNASANNVSVTSNVTVTGVTTLGDIANVKIAGGTANYVMKTDGLGNLSWTLAGGAAAGANYQVQYNFDSELTANANFTFDDTTSNLVVIGNIKANTLYNNGYSVINTISGVPTLVPTGEVVILPENKQAGYYLSPTIDGTFIVDGTLFQV